MGTLANRDYRFCTTVQRNVLVCESEGQCRDRTRCNAPVCPFAAEFGAHRLSQRVALLSATIGCSWLHPQDARL